MKHTLQIDGVDLKYERLVVDSYYQGCLEIVCTQFYMGEYEHTYKIFNWLKLKYKQKKILLPKPIFRLPVDINQPYDNTKFISDTKLALFLALSGMDKYLTTKTV